MLQHSTAHAIGLMAVVWAPVGAFVVTRRVIFPINHNIFSRLKYLSRRISGYVAISNAVLRELEEAGIASERIEMIPSIVNAPATSAEDGLRKCPRRDLGLSRTQPVITMKSGELLEF